MKQNELVILINEISTLLFVFISLIKYLNKFVFVYKSPSGRFFSTPLFVFTARCDYLVSSRKNENTHRNL